MTSKLKETKKAAKLNSVSFSSGDGNDRQDKRINVEAIENGFLITKTVEGRDKKGNWQYSTKKWFSAENPLEITSEDKSLVDLFD